MMLDVNNYYPLSDGRVIGMRLIPSGRPCRSRDARVILVIVLGPHFGIPAASRLSSMGFFMQRPVSFG